MSMKTTYLLNSCGGETGRATAVNRTEADLVPYGDARLQGADLYLVDIDGERYVQANVECPYADPFWQDEDVLATMADERRVRAYAENAAMVLSKRTAAGEVVPSPSDDLPAHITIAVALPTSQLASAEQAGARLAAVLGSFVHLVGCPKPIPADGPVVHPFGTAPDHVSPDTHSIVEEIVGTDEEVRSAYVGQDVVVVRGPAIDEARCSFAVFEPKNAPLATAPRP